MATHPIGKGMFVRNWKSTGTPAAAVEKARRAGLSWVSPLYGWWGNGTRGPRNESTAALYGQTFKDAGIEVWPWVYPIPSRHADVAKAIARARALDDDGVILDPEAEYRKKPAAAAQLLAVARAAAGPLAVGVSSYGYTKYHPTFPFAALSGADFGVPQVYDLKDSQKADYQRKGVQSWRDAGFEIVIPALTAASASYDEILQEYAQAQPIEDGAVVWWDWQTTQGSEWTAIGEIDLPGRTGLSGIVVAIVIAGVGFWLWKRAG